MTQEEYYTKEISTKDMQITIINPFNENEELTYEFVEDRITSEEMIKAEKLLNVDDRIDHGVRDNIPCLVIKENGENKTIHFQLVNRTNKPNDTRYIIEWYEGVWRCVDYNESNEGLDRTITEKLRKKGKVRREVFFSYDEYRERLDELKGIELKENDWKPIIVGTYKCKIVNHNPQEMLS